MANVGEMGKGLVEALEIIGRMDEGDARQWIIDNYGDEEEEPKNINLVLGYGRNPNRKWWNKEGTELVWIPEEERGFPSRAARQPGPDGLNGSSPALPTRETQAIQSPREGFASTLVVAGLKQVDADRLAQFMDTACDLMDPSQVWFALKDCMELSAANKRRVMRYWVRLAGLTPDPDQSREYLTDITDQVNQRQAQNPGDKWIAVDGETFRTDLSDPDGMARSEAQKYASIQRRNSGTLDNRSDQLFITFLEQMHETDRKRMELEAARQTNGNEAHQKRYVAVDGDLIPADEDDPEGLPASLAARLAVAQRQQGSKEDPEESFFRTFYREQQQTERTRMELDAGREKNGPDPSLQILVDAQRRESEATANSTQNQMQALITQQNLMFQSMQDQQNSMLLRMEDRITHQSDMAQRDRELQQQQYEMTLKMMETQYHSSIELLQAQLQNQPASPLESLNQVLPGVWEQFTTFLTSPPPAWTDDQAER